MITEKWHDIIGYEGSYQVSNLGRVRSLDRFVPRTLKSGKACTARVSGRILSPGDNGAGYLLVQLRNEALGAKTYLVHRLVAVAFIGPCPFADAEVNHLDGVKANNEVWNLEWVSRQGNQIHAYTLPRKTAAKVVVASRPGERRVFSSQQAAELELLGKATGIVSWAVKNGRQALGYCWSRMP